MCKVKKIPLLVTRDTIMGKFQDNYNSSWISTKTGHAQLDYLRNIPDKFQKNLNNGLKGDAIKRLSVLGKGEAMISKMAVWLQY